ncbi:MAG: hypothetical protein ABI639_10710 [Thermoanaerobaculia bacterium]
MAAPKRTSRVTGKASTKPLAVKKPPASATGDPDVELFGRAVAATQQRHWREAAVLFRRLIAEAGDDPGMGDRSRQYLSLCEQRLGEAKASEVEGDPYLMALFERNRGDLAGALALCRRGGRHRRDERMAYLAASILALKGELAESAELLALAVDQNPKNRVQAVHDSDFAGVLDRAEFSFILHPD